METIVNTRASLMTSSRLELGYCWAPERLLHTTSAGSTAGFIMRSSSLEAFTKAQCILLQTVSVKLANESHWGFV